MAGSTVLCPAGTTTIPTPADGDLLGFISGSQTITAGYDLSALTNGLAMLFFNKNATVTVPAATPIKCDVDYAAGSLVKYAQPGGEVNLHAGGGSGVINRIKHLGAGYLGLINGGTVTTYEQANGRAFFDNNVALTNYYGGGGVANILYKSTAITLIQNEGAVLNCERGGTTINLYGGSSNFFWQNPSGSLPTATTITCTGGRHRWMLGNITNLYLFGADAVFDVSNVQQALTITNLYIDALAFRNPANAQLLGRDFAVTKSNVYLRYDEGDTVA